MRYDILVAIWQDEPLTFYCGVFMVFCACVVAWSIIQSIRGVR